MAELFATCGAGLEFLVAAVPRACPPRLSGAALPAAVPFQMRV
jgi:hypothetical protein